LLGAVDQVRGFGPVKSAAAKDYVQRTATLQRSFFSSSPGLKG